MNKYYFSILLVGSLTLVSNACWRNPSTLSPSRAETERCVDDTLAPGEEKGLYGKNTCLQKNRYILIKTAKEGSQIATSNSKGNEETKAPDGLRAEGDVFMNKAYDLHYEYLKGEGDHKNYPWLEADFLPDSKDLQNPFLGTLDTEYKIVFRLGTDNYLWLYKASTELKNIPYIERTSMITDEINGDTHYMVPFIGYPVQYCNAKFRETLEGRELSIKEKNCESIKPEDAKYVHIDLSKGKNSHKAFKYDEKKDLFEKSYFQGNWFYMEGPIEKISASNEIVDEVSPRYTNLIKFNFGPNFLSLINISDSEERDNLEDEEKFKARDFKIVWREYEKYTDEGFGERLITDRSDPTTSRFFTIDMPDISEAVMEILVTPNYFSITYRIDTKFTVVDASSGNDLPIPKPRLQITFYREEAVDSKNFHEKKWFFDNSNIISLTPTAPIGTSQEPGAYNEADRNKFWRAIRFNLDNPGLNKITWYFSKNSTKDPYFRDIVKEAIAIYHRAFQIISEGTDKQFIVELAEEEQELGDIRYNIVNLTHKEKQMYSNLLGVAPSYVNPLTGQIIGGTSNIFLDNILEIAYSQIGMYIRYEIFQKGKTYAKHREDNNKHHVLTPYVRGLIEEYCKDDVLPFIEKHRSLYDNGKGELKPYENLTDLGARISCGKKISRDQILHLVLHEMGHNFGLAHNFIASADKNNHYKDEAEIQNYFDFQLPELQKGKDSYSKGLYKGLSKTSSVMEYLAFNVYPLTVLGKYDLEALRFLYTDQITIQTTTPKKSEIVPLKTSKNPEEQRQLNELDTLQGKNFQYESCPNWLQSGEKILCITHDYGATPNEIVEYRINNLRQALNSERYLYDINQPLTPENIQSVFEIKRDNFVKIVGAIINSLNNLYLHWSKLRNEKFKGQEERKRYTIYPKEQSDAQEEVINTYLDTICPYEKNSPDEISPCRINFEKPRKEEPKVKEGITDEYLAYYKVRETVMRFVREYMLMKLMKCEVQDITGDSRYINLMTITQYLSNNMSNVWYVEDCYSKNIQDFLKSREGEGLRVVGQVGLENNPYYHSSHHSNYKAHQFNISPALTLKNTGELNPVLLASAAFFTLFGNLRYEVDFLHHLRLTLEDLLFDNALTIGERNKTHFLLENIKSFYKEFQHDEQADMTTYITQYFGKKAYSTYSEHTASFAAQMANFIEKELYKPEKTGGIPFLVTQYNSADYQKYKQENLPQNETTSLSKKELYNRDALLFQDYLLGTDIIDDAGNKEYNPRHVLFFPENRRLIIPLQEHSRAFRHFARYNTNQERIDELDEKATTLEGLTFFEQIERERLKAKNKFIAMLWF